MQAILDGAWRFFTSYWEIVLLAGTWLGILALAFRRRRDWRRKRFTQQVNFSLNYVQDGTLRLRTLLEDSAERVWLNDYGVGLVRQAADRTTLEQPFLRLRSARDMDYVKRAVLNVLSERFSPAFVARALGAEVRTGRFAFGITWERYGNLRTQKLRVIVMDREQLDAIFDPKGGLSPSVAVPAHRDRLTTLRRMWELLHARKEKDRRLIGDVELGVLLPAVAVAPRVPGDESASPQPFAPLSPVARPAEEAPIEMPVAEDGDRLEGIVRGPGLEPVEIEILDEADEAPTERST